MTTHLDYADLPIETPEQDSFGFNAFAASLARSIRGMRTPQGVVIALHGPWGSGKSSVVNLLAHHLRSAIDGEELAIVRFNPWWFRGEEALVLAFFRELHVATKPSIVEQARGVLPKLGARLLKAGGIVGSAADLAGAGGAGSVAASTMDWLSRLIEDDESVEGLYRLLTSALAEQNKRFLVVIDDIDRLAPDEALAMFRLIKSVGRLPNVIYLLALDRRLADRVVADRFPSEGPHYLEKIIQVSFDLPAPDPADLRNRLLNAIFEVSGEPDERLIVHFMNLFHEIVAPEIGTPRDVVRYANGFSVTWPAVAGEVDQGDFVALEAYRLFRPEVYRAIRANPQTLCGGSDGNERRSESAAEALDVLLLSSVADKQPYRNGLMRLFPRLQRVWSNVIHNERDEWSRQRRACSAQHFPTYFRLTLSDDVVSQKEIDALLGQLGDPDAVKAVLLAAVAAARRNGGTRAAPLLDALQVHAERIELADAERLLSVVFDLADQLDVDADREKGFGFADNRLRIHWLIRALLFDRTSLAERSPILLSAATSASLGWLVDLSESAWRNHHPSEGKAAEPEDRCLLTEADARTMRGQALGAIERAAADGTLIEHPRLAFLLHAWRRMAGDDGSAVKSWTASRLEENRSIACIAKAFTSESWGQGVGLSGLGDFVAKRSDRASVDGIDQVLDQDRLRARVEELASSNDVPHEDKAVVFRFRAAWQAWERSPYD